MMMYRDGRRRYLLFAGGMAMGPQFVELPGEYEDTLDGQLAYYFDRMVNDLVLADIARLFRGESMQHTALPSGRKPLSFLKRQPTNPSPKLNKVHQAMTLLREPIGEHVSLDRNINIMSVAITSFALGAFVSTFALTTPAVAPMLLISFGVSALMSSLWAACRDSYDLAVLEACNQADDTLSALYDKYVTTNTSTSAHTPG